MGDLESVMLRIVISEKKIEDSLYDVFRYESDWVLIETSSNWKNPVSENEGQCECERNWTGKVVTEYFDHNPTQQEKDDCKAKTKEPSAPYHNCTGDCIWVVEDNWKDWKVFKHKKQERYFISCWWNKQWHCEKSPPLPDDPTITGREQQVQV